MQFKLNYLAVFFRFQIEEEYQKSTMCSNCPDANEVEPFDFKGSDENDELTLILNEGSFVASKSLLCSSSPYFAAMLKGPFKESQQKQVSIQYVSIEPMQRLVEYYSNPRSTKSNINYECLKLSRGNVFETLQAAGMLQFLEVKELCCEYVANVLPLTSLLAVLEVLAFAELLSETELKHFAMKIALCLFEELPLVDQGSGPVQSSAFVGADVNLLTKVISDRRLNVLSEWPVFRAIEEWVGLLADWDPEEKAEATIALISNGLRIHSLSDQERSDMLNKIALQNPSLHGRTVMAISAQGSQEMDPKDRCKVRPSCSRSPPVYPCVVGRSRQRISSPESSPKKTSRHDAGDLTLFLFRDGELCRMETPFRRHMDQPFLKKLSKVNGIRVCAVGHRILFVGGEFVEKASLSNSSWNMDVWCYDTVFNSWDVVASLETPRRHHALIPAEKDRRPPGGIPHKDGGRAVVLYLVGGFGRHRTKLDHVERLAISFRVGRSSLSPVIASENMMLPDLPQPLLLPTGCVLNGKLYVVKDKVYRLNLEVGSESSGQQTWETLTKVCFPSNTEFSFAVPYQDCIYLSRNSGHELYRLDPEDAAAGLQLCGRFATEIQNVCRVGNTLYNFSTEQFGSLSKVETFDLDTSNFAEVWQQDSDEFDLSPFFSVGCFPVLQY